MKLITFFLFLSTCSALATEPIRVMIIDTGVAIDHPLLKSYKRFYFTTADRTPDNVHGTAIASLVMNGILNAQGRASNPVCDKVELYVCNYKPFKNSENMISCLDKALSLKPKFINFSSTGTNFIPQEYAHIAALGARGTTFVTASGNEGVNIVENPHYPAMYAYLKKLRGPVSEIAPLSNVIIVGALTNQNTKWDLSNFGVPMQMEPGVLVRTAVPEGIAFVTGTSASTAVYTNKLIRQECAK